MSREYVISAGNITPTAAACTLIWVNPGTSQSLEILRCWASQSANATSAQQRIQTNTQVTAFPSTLVSATPGKLKLSDPVSVIAGGTGGTVGTSGINAGAEGAGTKTVLANDAFNVLNGWLWVATPPETYVMNASAAAGFGVHVPAAITPTTGWSFGLIFREL